MNPTDLANQASATAQRALELAMQARLWPPPPSPSCCC
jgi:hypothetical protein